MFNNNSRLKLYGENFTDNLFLAIRNKIAEEISFLKDQELLEINEMDFADKLYEKYSLDFPIIKLEEAFITTIEREIPAEQFPFSFNVFPGKKYKKPVIVYHIPFSGDIDILKFRANTFSTLSGYTFEIDRKDNCFIIEIINFNNDPNEIKNHYEDQKRYLLSDYGFLKNECDDFNSKLKESILHTIRNKKEQKSQRDQFLETLGIPVKKEEPKQSQPIKEPAQLKEKMSANHYDLAISFAGEDRIIAEDIANKLISLGYKIFYDKYEQANLWGKDLYEHLNDVYGKKAKLCLMIISKHYANKHWTNHERKAAQAKAFQQNEEYILPLRLDNTEIPGLNITVGYVDFHNTGINETINLLRQKIK